MPELLEPVVEAETKSIGESTQAATATLRRNYDKVFEDGTLVHLHVSMWSMSSQLSEDDLGVVAQPEIIKLGKKMLINPEIYNKFKRIEGKGRSLLAKSSFKFPIAEAHFVPNKRLKSVNELLAGVKLEYDTLSADFFQNYLTYKQEILDKYPDLKEKLEPFYPPVENIKTRFGFEWTEFRLAMPKEFGEYDLNAKIAEEKVIADAQANNQVELQAKAQKQASMIESFVSDIGKEVRGTILTTCLSVLDRVQKKEIVSKGSIDALLRRVTDFEELNFLDDGAVEARLVELKGLLTADGPDRFKYNKNSMIKLEEALKNVIVETQKVTDVDDLTGKYFRSIELE